MIDPIFNTVNAIFGRRGTGKTIYLLGDKFLNVPGLVPLYPKKDMKVLIVDTIDHPAYKHIPIIKPKDLSRWKKGVYRIWVKSYEMPELNRLINETLYNTLLVYEDAYKHQQSKLDRSIMELIGDSKQKNVDIIFMYHSFALAPLDLYRYLDNIEIFKTKDTPEVRKDAMTGYYDDAMKIHQQVMANPSRFYHKSLCTEL